MTTPTTKMSPLSDAAEARARAAEARNREIQAELERLRRRSGRAVNRGAA